MADPSPASTPGATLSPQRFLSLLQGAVPAAVMNTALNLDVFTRVAGGAATAAQIAAQCGAAERGARILCDALCALGFLARAGDGYGLTPESDAFLVRGRPGFLGSVNGVFTNPMLWNGLGRLEEAVRRGGTVMDQNALTPDHPFWQDFARSLTPLATLNAQKLADHLGVAPGSQQGLKVLDVACGSGAYGFTLAQRDSRAHVTALDYPSVLEITRRYAAEMGVLDRVAFLPGSLFDVEFPGGLDLALACNIFHHFDLPTCRQVADRLAAALRPGGRLAFAEMVPDAGRTGPPNAALFAVIMLMWTHQGDAYTLEQYRGFLEPAGFRHVELFTDPHAQAQFITAERA